MRGLHDLAHSCTTHPYITIYVIMAETSSVSSHASKLSYACPHQAGLVEPMLQNRSVSNRNILLNTLMR